MKSAFALMGFLVLTFLAPVAGALAAPGDWYHSLAKPTWTPPSWLFGSAWTFLYLGMAVAAWGVWRKVGWSAPIYWWLFQLILNAAWMPLFFGLRQPGWAFAEILLLWAAIAMTLVQFFKIARWAGVFMVPYLAWVTFASVLNCVIWRMNPQLP